MTEALDGPGAPDYLNKLNGLARLRDMPDQPHSADLLVKHASAENCLEMPVCYRGEHIGNICLVEKEGGTGFTEEDEHMAAMFAAQAASIISNTRRYREAHRARSDMETLMEICPVAVSVFDVRLGEISYMNQECRRLIGALGLADDNLDNIFLSLKLTGPDGREIPFAELPGTRAIQSGETVTAEEIVVHRTDGTTLTTLVNCAPIFSGSGAIVSVLSVMQDMTPLEDQERRRAAFLGVVSEELRTPVTAIKGSASALRSIMEEIQPTESAQLLRIIDQQADLMRSQINSLIELTQIETGTLSVNTESVDVATLIERSCGEYLRDHTGVAIQLDTAEGLATVLADRRRISKVLHNFLRQAAAYSIESSPLIVSAGMVDIHVAISVSAAGSLVPPEGTPFPMNATEHPQLLKKASQAHAKAAELASKGEGLAMAYCRGVVEAHGGRVSADIDEQGGRLTLTFTLPSVEDSDEIQPSDLPGIASEQLPAPEGKTQILVSVEDPKLLRTVRRVLFDAGYGTVETSGLDEIERLASSESPELILLDIAGREETSFRALRGAEKSLNLPAIVFCDRDDEEYVVRAFEMGADGYMVKPFSPSELVARIKATLRRSNAGEKSGSSRTFQSGDVVINFDERTVNVSGQPVQLTATEYKLLTELSNSAGRVLTQDMLLHKVWGPGYSGESQLLRSYIKSLRQKLGDDARKPSYIFTEHGVGYRMAKP